uniref:F-box domain-containing protein n=1 Tax=Aegilops tauschii subsp. strangulata TaxID=200361 RepID=A0A452YYD7_AEGTS
NFSPPKTLARGRSMPPPPPSMLMEELLEEVFFRLLPDEPAWLVRASAVCKPWRSILADPVFRRRYREFHGTPPVLGLFEKLSPRLVPIPAFFPAQTYHPDWAAMDCRHGRALFCQFGETRDLIVLDPLTGRQCQVPSPPHYPVYFSAAVLCAAQGCDHHNCQAGHFRVVMCPSKLEGVTLGWMYSSETRLWTELTSDIHPTADYYSVSAMPSILVGDALYFNVDAVIECQLGTLCFSMFEKPTDDNGTLMMVEDDVLGFAAVVDVTLTLWSREAGPEGAMGWIKLRVIDLKTLLPNVALFIPSALVINGYAEGTQVIFVRTSVGCYMVDLKLGRSRKVSYHGRKSFPYTSFYIPGITYLRV